MQTMITTDVALFWKTHEFLSFQISHLTKRSKENRAFLSFELLWRTPSHQVFTVSKCCQRSALTWRPSQETTSFQNQRENQHLKRRWAVDSYTWLQRGHQSQFGHSQHCSLFAVQIPFWVTIQVKNLYIWEMPKPFRPWIRSWIRCGQSIEPCRPMRWYSSYR